MTVALIFFACPVACRLYSVVAHGYTPDYSQSARKNLDVSCGPLSVETLDSIPNFATQSLMKKVKTIVAVVLVVGVAFVSFESLSIVIKMT